ncbi:NitT/TauT family transport system substrate-binding protein [Xanthobacter flavus]|uniref:Thiamine pyrimidine synthase n=1 Tax=Xanthobacter flavus TaxID=281 RepID=A0A9W6CNF6_XANFL|nr:ABC transporter substrate-binding protein [Xanthobacter flavus]MDR6335169.1 NitT/TauT family transport system substrate-binding protein [Xanthobacter flavus]GLI23605.1 myristoyl transferase [Xanthobacter flavus]
MWTERRSLLKLTAAAGIALSGLLAPVVAQAADKVKLRLDWVFGSEHAPIFLALERGYFRDEGIDVDLLPGEGSSVTVKLVGNRDAEFGYATADQILIGAQRGLDLVATAVVLQQNPTAFIFKTSQNIKDVKTDLYGKTIGVQLKSNTGRQWEAMKKDLKLDPAKLREVPADGALVAMIASNRIDVGVGFYFNDALKLRATGEDVSWILFEDLGMKMYSTSLLTNPALVKEKPDLVKRFTRAFLKGWQAAIDDPKAAYEAFIKANPSTDKVYAELKLPEVLKLTQSPDVKQNGLGHSTTVAWESLQAQLIAMEMMKDKTDISKVFTNDFLK